MRALVLTFFLILLPVAATALAVETSKRPVQRPMPETRVASVGALERSIRPIQRIPREDAPEAIPARANPAGFTNWLRSFQTRAARRGITRDTLAQAFRNIEYLPDVIELDRNQSEFTKTIWEYLDTAVSNARVRNGRAALRRHARVLDQIERTYGVDKEIVVAVWGLETSYGSFRGSHNVFSALATLAYDGRRGAFFEAELINALRILQAGDASARNMSGSWAGAMGHTQFMPSSFLQYAVDFTGDGRRDIWGRSPADALASTANYLRSHGWTSGRPWGAEVRLPEGFNHGLTGERTRKSAAEWNRLGVRLMDGSRVPDHGRASILVPGGAGRVAFVIYSNFQVIERYNPADAYVIAIGHLADRIQGGPAIEGTWPRGDRGLRGRERRELQRRLRRAGFDPGAVDGRIGPETLNAVRRYQESLGVTVDGYVSLALLQRLRGR